MTTRSILVTGGTGFIGSAVVRRLVNDGHRIRVVDNDLRGSAARLADLEGRFELAACDVRDVEAMTSAAEGMEMLLHLAALNGTENFYNRPDLVLDVGVRGMYAALDAARAAGVKEFVLASSSEAYQTAPVIPTPEDVPLMIPDPWNPRFSYGGSKLISEIMLANYHRDFFERAISFRPHNVYGPDMGWEHVIPQFALRIHDEGQAQPDGVLPIKIQGDGSQTRAFIHIDDFLDGLMLVMFKGEHRNTYHIGTMAEVTMGDLVRLVGASLGREIDVVGAPLLEGSTERRCPDIGKLSNLGFAPQTSLRDGVAETARWYADNADRRPSA
ncbi:MAG TPA: SDR family NAD(P)-dependent oxidoreductase [Allosphingosinicella sp.]|uniref:NAD-dependent epimerase/dehydratase family protein n=1 Tax=Allosphingosinicella sp. TaxID=2823234 RepID=UPI002EDAA1A9